MTTESNRDRGDLCLKRLRNADDLIERYVANGILPGAVTLVARHGEIVHFKT